MSERAQDVLWDTLDECFGKVRTKSERGRRNAALKELREAGVTPDELRIAFYFCERRFTHFTEKALCNWLSRALHEEGENQDQRASFIRLLRKE